MTFVVKTDEDLKQIKDHTDVYYCMSMCDPQLLEGVVNIKFYDKIVLTSKLPNTIKSITFDSYYDTEILPNILPDDLEYLDLGWYFTKTLTDEILPKTTKILIFGYWYNKPLTLTPRNLEKIVVKDNYKCIVSKEILHLMPESYKSHYDTIVINNTFKFEDCLVLSEYDGDVSSDEDDDHEKSDDEHEKSDNEDNYSVKYSNKLCTEHRKLKLDLIKDKIKTHLDSYSDTKCEVFVNDKKQIVIIVEFSYWNFNRYVFIGCKDNYYRTYNSHINIPKPYRLYTNIEQHGAFTLDEMIEQLSDSY